MNINIQKLKKYPPLLNRDYVSAQIQKTLIENHFKWIKMYVNNGILYGGGTLKLNGLKKEYKILLKYDPNLKGRKDFIFIQDDQIKFNSTPHLYNDNSLCLYYPKDIPRYKQLNFIDTIPWISKWLISYEIWLKYGIWLDREIKH